MDLISLLVALVVLGLVWYLYSQYLAPLLPPPVQTIIVVLLVLFLIIWLLR
jgi:hypothetical protein